MVVGSTSFNVSCYAHVKKWIIVINDDFIFILMFQLVGHTFGYCDISVLKGHWVSISIVHDKVRRFILL